MCVLFQTPLKRGGVDVLGGAFRRSRRERPLAKAQLCACLRCERASAAAAGETRCCVAIQSSVGGGIQLGRGGGAGAGKRDERCAAAAACARARVVARR